jgi:hypothetical protein
MVQHVNEATRPAHDTAQDEAPPIAANVVKLPELSPHANWVVLRRAAQ